MKFPEYNTKEDVIRQSDAIVGRTLADIIPAESLLSVWSDVRKYGKKRKGFLGNLVEEYVFGKKADSKAEADFAIAGVELKTTPLKKHNKKALVAKERLVFSMIDYTTVGNEKWETSSFLSKNALVLLLFYLYEPTQELLNYRFRLRYLLDFINGLQPQERLQIKKDWEYIIAKVHAGNAHLLSEADTMYLSACTKGKNAQDVRMATNANQTVPAKRRAFSLKKGFLDRIVERELSGVTEDIASLGADVEKTVEESTREKIVRYVGMTDIQLAEKFEVSMKAKNWRQLLITKMLTGKQAKAVEELQKADVEMRVLTLEKTGTLKESIPFPTFDFKNLILEDWYVLVDDEVRMAELHQKLDEKKFLFVVFQKENKDSAVFKGAFFWNFPAEDLHEAKKVWQKTREVIESGEIISREEKQKDGTVKTYNNFPGQAFNEVMHVRPHGSTKEDTLPLPYTDVKTGRKEFTKQSFWLNAKYIEKVIQEHLT